MATYKRGDIVYIVANQLRVEELRVESYTGGFYTLRFLDDRGGIRLRESRLFATKAEAEAQLKHKRTNTKYY